MQNVSRAIAPSSSQPQNPLQVALDNYDQMETDLKEAESKIEIYEDQLRRLSTENEGLRRQNATQGEFFSRQLDVLTNQRDRLAAVVKGLTTRFKVIRECFTQCEADALAEGLVERTPEQVAASDADEEALRNLKLADASKRPPLPRPRLPVNQM